MKPIISVVVPVYNVEYYLDACVQSVLNQSFTNFELILVDDGSTDSSGTKCDEWKKCDGRIHVIHKPNGGVSDARNVGIVHAQGQYIALLDSDDYFLPDWLKNLYEAAMQSNADIVKGGTNFISMETPSSPIPLDYNAVPFKTIPFKNESISSQEYLRRLLNWEGYNCVWNQIAKTDLYKQNPFPLNRLNEDHSIYFDILKTPCKIEFIDYIGVCYRQRIGSVTNLKKDSFIANIIEDYLCHLNIMLSRYSDAESAKIALVRATELFFFYLASAQRMESIKSDLTKATWKKLYPVTKNYDMKQLLPKVLFFQYKIYSISDSLYYQIMRIKKAVSK